MLHFVFIIENDMYKENNTKKGEQGGKAQAFSGNIDTVANINHNNDYITTFTKKNLSSHLS